MGYQGVRGEKGENGSGRLKEGSTQKMVQIEKSSMEELCM